MNMLELPHTAIDRKDLRSRDHYHNLDHILRRQLHSLAGARL